MDIIHIVPGKANPNSLNGVNKVVHCIAEEQVKSGHNVTVIGVANNQIKRHTHNYNLILFKNSPVKIVPPIKLLSNLIKAKKKAIIHIHSAFVMWFPLLVLFLKIIKLNFVLTPHGAYTVNNLKSNKLKLPYFVIIEWILPFLASKVQVIGKSEVNNFTKLLVNSKLIKITNGSYVLDDYVKEKSQNMQLGYVGRLKIDHKGLDILLNGFSLYKKREGTAILNIVGDGPDKEKLVNMIKLLELKESVNLLGVKYDKDKFSFLASSSYFVHTSRWEGFPTACIESLSVGTPLLVSKETNMGDLVLNNNIGFVLKNNNSNQVAEILFRMEKLYNDHEYDKLVVNSKNVIKKKLNWSIISQDLVRKLYKLS